MNAHILEDLATRHKWLVERLLGRTTRASYTLSSVGSYRTSLDPESRTDLKVAKDRYWLSVI